MVQKPSKYDDVICKQPLMIFRKITLKQYQEGYVRMIVNFLTQSFAICESSNFSLTTFHHLHMYYTLTLNPILDILRLSYCNLPSAAKNQSIFHNTKIPITLTE